MASVVSRAACEVEKDNMCTVCMDCIPEKNQCERPCGHMMCVSCDAAWRSRGKIEEIKMNHNCKKSKEKMSIYMTVSNCPSCRRKDSPYDYRSKLSMFHEIQFLTRTLYISGIRVPIPYQAPRLNDMEEAVTPPAPAPLLRRIDVFTPYIPTASSPVAAVAPVVTPVVTPVVAVAAPVAAELPPIPPSSQSTGICCLKVQRIGACYTTRTKLKCARCQRFLCRSCRGSGCVCQSL